MAKGKHQRRAVPSLEPAKHGARVDIFPDIKRDIGKIASFAIDYPEEFSEIFTGGVRSSEGRRKLAAPIFTPLRPLTPPLPVSVAYKKKRHHNISSKPQQTRSSTLSESVIHVEHGELTRAKVKP